MIKFIFKLIFSSSFRKEVRPVIDTIEVASKLSHSSVTPSVRGGIFLDGKGDNKIENCFCTGEIEDG